MRGKRESALADGLDNTLQRLRGAAGFGWLVVPGGGPGFRKPAALPAGTAMVRTETHGFIEICVCLRGCFHLATGERQGYVLRPGDVCLILPGTAHAELPGPGYMAAWFLADSGRAVAHLSGRSESSPFSVTDMHVFKPGAEPVGIAEGMLLEAGDGGPGRPDCLAGSVVRLLELFLREVESPCAGPTDAEQWKGTIVGEAAAYIRSNVRSRILLTDVAQAVCLSANHLNALFKSRMGRTIMQYHEECRMEAARAMLADGGGSLNDIAAQLGYYDPYHFSKAFKKAVGLSPSAYRAQSREQSLAR